MAQQSGGMTAHHSSREAWRGVTAAQWHGGIVAQQKVPSGWAWKAARRFRLKQGIIANTKPGIVDAATDVKAAVERLALLSEQLHKILGLGELQT